MAYTAARVDLTGLQPDGSVKYVLTCTGDSGEEPRMRTVQVGRDTPFTLAELQSEARAWMARLNAGLVSTMTITPGPISIAPPATPPPDALSIFAQKWMLFRNGQRGIDMGVLLPTDPLVASLKADITDALATATAAQKRQLVATMFST